ncbi:DUF3850 domain-containing protein [Salmonella enterica subsp. enterica]|nr:DUF3850 domain-containing protein [Salmonella enterica subsp. enterica serovar Nigeria]EBF9480318.1 DUF3850 domain-containing protein [Salmonella enterica subsp. enterica serovar Nigeria]EBG0435245.1 DUF3850 domain-containing protein [Salmonella enterica subsp. enterica serovar Nigeria]EBG2918122.1 DUF3850 domain-containing protein [Salmonella enterica subsp. enterica serovar Nigeria]EEN5964665.1 DUF3850 domain-containing protein [Salmonella enterica subsp. enterica serovar Nigeria]
MTNTKLTGVEHNLKIAPEYFAAVVAGVKHAEMRFNDRNYQTGDVLNLCEWDDGTFTGAFVSADVTHVCELPSVPGYALLSFELQERRKADSAEPKDGEPRLHIKEQPVPVVPEECPDELLAFCEQVIDSRITANAKADELWNACRTAMLRGNHRDLSQPIGQQVAEYEKIMLQGSQPVSDCDELSKKS